MNSKTSFLKRALLTLGLCIFTLGFTALSLTSCNDDDAPRPGDGQKVAAILKADDAYWKHVARGIEAAATEAGLTAEIHYAAADVDSEGQLKALAALDLTQYKGIIIAPSAPDAMKEGIKKIAAQLPVVVIDSPIDAAVGYHAFIGMDNTAAGRQLHDDMIRFGEETGAGGSSAVPTVLIFQLEGSPAIAERVEGYMAAATAEGEKVQKVLVPDNAAKIAAKYAEAIAAMGDTPYSLFAANGTVADVLLDAMEKNNQETILLAFDVTEPILKAIGNKKTLTMAQDNYGYGYEGVKALLAPATGKAKMLAPMFITFTNVGDADIARYLNGYEAPEIK